jgi:hypothetical protein
MDLGYSQTSGAEGLGERTCIYEVGFIAIAR